MTVVYNIFSNLITLTFHFLWDCSTMKSAICFQFKYPTFEYRNHLYFEKIFGRLIVFHGIVNVSITVFWGNSPLKSVTSSNVALNSNEDASKILVTFGFYLTFLATQWYLTFVLYSCCVYFNQSPVNCSETELQHLSFNKGGGGKFVKVGLLA